MEQLILVLLPVITKYGPSFVHGVVDLIHGNPQKPGQSDAEWVAETNQAITAKLADADQKADTVINDQNK